MRTLADLIRKGVEEYPEVRHTREQYVVFMAGKPAFACAVGYALLGEFNGELTPKSKIDDYVERLDKKHSTEMADAVYWNDEKGMALDAIIARLEGERIE